MNPLNIAFHIGADPAIETFLEERIYEFNAAATGYFDAEPYSATHRNEAGEVVAAICGYTWGGCCHITYLWVSAQARRNGLGRRLIEATEAHALTQQCSIVFVSSHSFQAPDFYARLGFEPQCILRDNPVGHSSVILAKRLRLQASPMS